MEPYEEGWKDYYKILRLTPAAGPQEIKEAYQRLAHLYQDVLSDSARDSEIFTMGMRDITEAYEILSEPARRAEYDRILETEHSPQEIEAVKPVGEEIADLMAVVDRDMSKRKMQRTRRVPGWTRVVQQVVVIAVISLLVIVTGGSSFAFAQPENTLATPFKGVAIAVAETSSNIINLIEDIRGVVASYERNIIATSLQSMRILEGVREVAPVTVPTNDMASFPSPQHPLYPEYLDRRHSQFKYTVDSAGAVEVDTSGATTDALLRKIEQVLSRLEEEE